MCCVLGMSALSDGVLSTGCETTLSGGVFAGYESTLSDGVLCARCESALSDGGILF